MQKKIFSKIRLNNIIKYIIKYNGRNNTQVSNTSKQFISSWKINDKI